MRIALLAMMEPAGTGQPLPRAFLRVAGATLAQHQLGLALALNCQRVVCFAREMAPELIALQHAAEDAGLKFAVVTSARQLAGLVTAADELVVVGEGLFVEPAKVVPLLEGSNPVVLVQPIEAGLVAGFERIDLNRASAGLMRIPGQMAERLHELPADCDIGSALTRIALQSGAEMRDVPASARSGADWRLIRAEADALALENEWLRARFGDGATSPGRALARWSVVSFGSSLLHAGNASNALSIAVVALVAIAAVLGWFGVACLGFVLTAMAWGLAEASRFLRFAERHALGQLPPAIPRADVLVWLVDAALALLILADSQRLPGQSFLSWLTTPAILMLLIGLLPRVLRGTPALWANDRLVLGLILAVAATVGQVLTVVQLISVGLIVAGLVLPARARG